MAIAMPTPPRDAFERDVCAYLAKLPTLLSENEGKYVLIGNADLAAIYDSQREAMREGYVRFPDRGFLVQEVSRFDLEMGMHWQRSCLP